MHRIALKMGPYSVLNSPEVRILEPFRNVKRFARILPEMKRIKEIIEINEIK